MPTIKEVLYTKDNEQVKAFLESYAGILNLPYVPNPVQLEFHLAEQVGSEYPVLYGGAMGGGKSWALSADAIRECLEVPNNRVLMARKELVTFKNTTMTALEQLMPQGVDPRPSGQLFIFPNGSRLHYTGLGTDKDKAKLQSSEWGAIYIDEATEIELNTFLMAGTRLRWTPAARIKRTKMRLSCNPEPGWIKERFITEKEKYPKYRFIPALPTDNLHLKEGYIEEQRASLPDEWFRAYMLGDWDAFLPQNTVLSPMSISIAMRTRVPVQPYWPAVWGVDVARFGEDLTVLCERRGGLQYGGTHFHFLHHWRKTSVEETAEIILGWWYRAQVKPTCINIDDDGVGGGVTDILSKASRGGTLPGTRIRGVIAQSSRVHDPVHYMTVKAENWFRLKMLLERQQDAPVQLPSGPTEFRTGLESQRYEPKGGKVFLEPKRIIKQRTGFSPDHADALVLTMDEAHPGYVAYKTEEEELAELLTTLPEDARKLYAQHHLRMQKQQRAMTQLAKLLGVRQQSGPFDVPY